MSNNEEYESYQPGANGLLNPDGSVTTLDGSVVSPANEEGAEKYKSCAPKANKFINPDGSIHTLDEISGGGTKAHTHLSTDIYDEEIFNVPVLEGTTAFTTSFGINPTNFVKTADGYISACKGYFLKTTDDFKTIQANSSVAASWGNGVSLTSYMAYNSDLDIYARCSSSVSNTSGAINYSVDRGKTWIAIKPTLPQTGTISNFIYYKNYYYITINSVSTINCVLRSEDLITWSALQNVGQTNYNASSLTLIGDTLYIGLSGSGAGIKFLYTDDNATFSTMVVTPTGTHGAVGIAYGNGRFVVSKEDAYTPVSWYSLDRVTWTQSSTSVGLSRFIYYDGSRFLCGQYSGTSSSSLTVSDGGEIGTGWVSKTVASSRDRHRDAPFCTGGYADENITVFCMPPGATILVKRNGKVKSSPISLAAGGTGATNSTDALRQLGLSIPVRPSEGGTGLSSYNSGYALIAGTTTFSQYPISASSGTSTSTLMHQKGITDAINAAKVTVVQEEGQSTTNVMSQKAVNDYVVDSIQTAIQDSWAGEY